MNADETVRALRAYAKNAQENNEFYTMQDFDAAADTIERLNDFEHSQCAKLLARIAELEAQLTETQRRERAAVEDLTKMAKCKLLGTCTFCEHRNTPDMRYKPCNGCIQENRSRKNFQWRGSQEAGEGGNV